MKQLTPEVLAEAVTLIGLLRSSSLDDTAISATVARLNALLLEPYWFAYTIDHEPEIPAEEAVRRAFEYPPIMLPGASTLSQS
jgi:hypothetical protein